MKNQAIFTSFVEDVIEKLKLRTEFVGLAIGGSWLHQAMDEYSDLDLVLVFQSGLSEQIMPQRKAIAQSFGKLLQAFTGEHVGEPRLLICLYDEPLLHVDLKFVSLDDFSYRVENQVIAWEINHLLSQENEKSEAKFPMPDLQWIEDRFWIWLHYVSTKLGRGELLEALDFLSFLRMIVLGPLVLIKNGKLPRGVRKVEFDLPSADLDLLQKTTASYDKKSIIEAIQNAVLFYQMLRNDLKDNNLIINELVEKRTIEYFEIIRQKN